MKSDMNAIYVIGAREFIKFVRERGRLISTLARPLLWLFLVGGGMSKMVSPDMGMPYMQFIFPGIIGMTILFSSIFSSISIIWDKEFGFMKEMLVAPVSRFSIVIGKALSGTMVSTFQALIIVLLFPVIGLRLGIDQIILILCISAMLSFCLASLGILIAVFYELYHHAHVLLIRSDVSGKTPAACARLSYEDQSADLRHRRAEIHDIPRKEIIDARFPFIARRCGNRHFIDCLRHHRRNGV